MKNKTHNNLKEDFVRHVKDNALGTVCECGGGGMEGNKNCDKMKIGTFYGKEIGANMTKGELLTVIRHVINENERLRGREITPEEEVRRLTTNQRR